MKLVRVVVALALVPAPAIPAAAQQAPTITVTTVPPAAPGGPDRMARIAGTVAGASCDCKLVIWARGDVYYVQPWANAPFTSIRDGKWEADTHLGTEYVVALVRSSTKPPPPTTMVPPALSEDVLAVVRVPGRK